MAKISDAWKVDGAGKRVKCYVIRYLDRSKLNAKGKPVHRQEKFDKKKHAEARLLALQNEMASGSHIAKSEKLSVAAICDHFLRHQENRARDGRIGRHLLRSYGFSVNKSIVPRLGGKLFADLSMADIDDFYTGMVRHDNLAPTTALARVSHLTQIEDFAARRSYIVTRTVQKARAELKGIPRAKIKTFSPEQVQKLLKTAATFEKGHKREPFWLVNCFVNIAAFCGLRYGEISALSLDTVDLEKRMIYVRRSLSFHDGLKRPKTSAGLRDVPMPAHVAEMIRTFIELHYSDNEHHLIFVGSRKQVPHGHYFHANNWRPLLKRAGLYRDGEDGLHFHALRHFAASWLVTKLPLTDVAQIMGHSKYDMTLSTYAHPITAGHRRHEAVDDMASTMLLPLIEGVASVPVSAAQI